MKKARKKRKKCVIEKTLNIVKNISTDSKQSLRKINI